MHSPSMNTNNRTCTATVLLHLAINGTLMIIEVVMQLMLIFRVSSFFNFDLPLKYVAIVAGYW